MSDINLSKAVRTNLLSLQSTANIMAKTQTRLATGLRVNTALDNPGNFFTAASLNGRAGDMSNLLDSISSGIKTIETADNGLSAITKTVESMQSTLRQARQDKSYQTQSFSFGDDANNARTITFDGGSLGDLTTAISVGTVDEFHKTTFGDAYQTVDFSGGGSQLYFQIKNNDEALHDVLVTKLSATSLNVRVDGHDTATTVVSTASVQLDEMISALNNGLDGAGVGATVGKNAGTITITSDKAVDPSIGQMFVTSMGAAGTVDGTHFIGTHLQTYSSDAQFRSVDAIATAINGNAALNGAVRAANDNGKLRIENLSTEPLNVGNTSGGVINGATDSTVIGGNDVRGNLAKQFNDLRDQLDKLADDSSFNGINLLRGDKLKLTFNETGSSTIDVQAKDGDGEPTSIDSLTLGIDAATKADFGSDTAIDGRLDTLKNALTTLRSQSSTFGMKLSVVENRNDFTRSMINTLESGAADLTLADSNGEAASMLALQTRQQLGSSALSMASQADQGVLRLF